MAVISLLFSFLARKANDIIQAIFGWSITALFGKLPRRSQVLITAALVCSLAWPVFVIGAFAPKIAGWLLAFVPLHKLVGTEILRIIWLTLAVLVSTFGCLASTLLYSSRIYLPMAEDGLFFRSMARIHPRWRVPTG